MRRLICLLALCVVLSGCGMFRKVFKSKEYSKLEASSKTRKDSVGLIIDKSITTIRERVDTTIIIPGQVVQQDVYLNIDSLVNGLTAVKNDLIDVTLHLNPITGILSVIANIKPQKVPIKMDRETVKQNDIVQQSAQHSIREAALKQSSGSSLVEKEPIKIIGWLIAIGIVIFVVIAIVYWRRNRVI